MSIFVDSNTKVIYQGLTGSQGRYYGLLNRDYGTQVVGGTNPKKAGEEVEADAPGGAAREQQQPPQPPRRHRQRHVAGPHLWGRPAGRGGSHTANAEMGHITWTAAWTAHADSCTRTREQLGASCWQGW